MSRGRRLTARAPQDCGPWTLIEPLGSGATATVWRAEDRAGREAALKLLSEPDGTASRHLLLAEVTALGRIDHPLAPRLLWVGDNAFATELIRGRPLSKLARRPMTRERLLPLLLDLLDVLAHVHALGIVHRDLKPDNLLIESVPATARGKRIERLRVVDFGLAATGAAVAFRRRELAGTLAYMAPEQRAGDAIDGRADLYSVGAIAAEILGPDALQLESLLAKSPGRRTATADEAMTHLLAAGDEPYRDLARPPRDVPVSTALCCALSTARVPESLLRHAPAQRLTAFLTTERRAGHLRRSGGRWFYDAPVTCGDALYGEGRVDEAIESYLREGAVLRAVDLLRHQQEYSRAQQLLEDFAQQGKPLSPEAQLAYAYLLVSRREHAAALAAFRALPARAPAELRANAACGEGGALLGLGRVEEARGRFLASVELARAARRPALESKALSNLGLLAARRGQAAAAQELFREAIATARAGGDPVAATAALLNLGVIYEERHQLDLAVAAYEDVVDASARMGNRSVQCTGLLNLGNISARRLELSRARHQYESALALARDIDDREREGLGLLNVANLQTLVGRFAAAVTSATAAIERLEGTPRHMYLAFAYRNRAEAALRLGAAAPAALAAAENDLERAQICATRAGGGAILTEIELDQAGIEAARGLLRHAATRASRALVEAKASGYRDHAIRAHVVLAAIFNRGGLHKRALAEAREVEEQAASAGIVLHRLDALREGALALEALGQGAQARAVRRSIERAQAALADAYGR